MRICIQTRIAVLAALSFFISAGSALGQIAFELEPHWNTDLRDNLFREGELRQRDDHGFPVGWNDVSAFESGDAIMLEKPQGIAQLKCPAVSESGQVVGETSISATIGLPERIKFVTILSRMRGPTIELGTSDRTGAGMVYGLVRRDGTLRELPRVEPIYKFGSLGGWKTYRSTARVLPGEKQLVVRATIVDAKGEFEVDRVIVLKSQPGYAADPAQVEELRRAIASDDVDTVRELIKATPELLEFRNGTADNGTPLILASWYNSANVAKQLAMLGANLEASDESWSNTPLAWCCWWGNAETAEVLINAGANLKQFETMAQNCKQNNKHPRGTIEDFDKITQLVLEAKKAAMDGLNK